MSSCNGCQLERMKAQYGDKLIKYLGSWYLKGEQPLPGQTTPSLPDGTPIQFKVWYMSEGHDHDTEDNYDEIW